ncbi:hypothetical protein A2121_00430 [Candidatus Nomurabacteria bacterium GWB1_40_6]|uniref:Uncharacterized protein n=1 Tax=Candidatus Nomurabacteria bacterium GWB1_40_6 TaxID=1801727 RepID=A0A1F6TLP1_9BACT|nr:MAG: hypothetical protein A2121_00430 [Candidatus Nomurabacteria bacterium GWB1_40_6]
MIGGQPQPSKNVETVSVQKICEEMREIAKKLPKPSGDIKEEGYEHTQFGHNFYLLFVSTQKGKSVYGEKWKEFLSKNVDLMNQIQKALIPIDLYFQLLYRFNKILYNQKNSDLAFQMGQEINLIGICAEAWDKLNPLLKQAKEAMIVNGMNPEDFY